MVLHRPVEPAGIIVSCSPPACAARKFTRSRLYVQVDCFRFARLGIKRCTVNHEMFERVIFFYSSIIGVVESAPYYSVLSVSIGSMDAALRAGTKAAIMPQAVNSTQTDMIVTASCPPTPKRKLLMA
jgi:hypothetical protein